MKKSVKIIIGIIAAVFVIDAALFAKVVSGKKNSNIGLQNIYDETIDSMIALNQNARTSVIREGDYLYYQFTEKQKKSFEECFEQYKNASLLIRAEISYSKETAQRISSGELPFNFGFLYADDFSDKGNFLNDKVSAVKKITVNADEAMFVSEENGNYSYAMDISLAIKKTDQNIPVIPEGFFVYSVLKCRIKGAGVVPSEIGFDYSSDIPFYGFSSNGGNITRNNSIIDFTGGSLIFPAQNTKSGIMPEIVVSLTSDKRYESTLEKSIRVKMKIGSEKIFVKVTENAKKLIIPSGSLVTPFPVIELTDNRPAVTGLIMRNSSSAVKNNSDNEFSSSEICVPIKTDPGLILNYSPKNWRSEDYEIFEWDRLPGIIFFDTRNYTVQDNFFRRLAFYIEKAGYKGRLLTNSELGTMHGFNALDYRAETLADFFNKATELDFKLNKEEILLKKILLANGILIADGQRVKPGYGAIVSISQESSSSLRVQLLAHEAWHMLFFIDDDFRNYTAAAYYTMDPRSREFLIDYFRSQPSLGYDVTDEYLMHNEFMAYILQNSFSNVGQYFVNHAQWKSVMSFTPELCDYVIKTNGQGFTDAAVMLENYVFDKYGVICGCLNLVQR
ncbi:MAG: hypothetical protein IKX23_04755 [Treponema sp.]|nr:hypothetical protein [Treponema sp.]